MCTCKSSYSPQKVDVPQQFFGKHHHILFMHTSIKLCLFSEFKPQVWTWNRAPHRRPHPGCFNTAPNIVFWLLTCPVQVFSYISMQVQEGL